MHYEFFFVKMWWKPYLGWSTQITLWEDLKECNIRPHLWLQARVVDHGSIKQVASYVLKNEEKERFIQIFEDTYTICLFTQEDNQGPWFKGHEVTWLPHYDVRILSLCMRHLVTNVWGWQLFACVGFSKGCGSSNDGGLEKEMAITLALLEQEFSPSFFEIMIHLLIHLIEELELCGLVQTKWMYFIERYLKTLKGYVGNRAKLEGSMAKRICNRGSNWVLHWISCGFYSHKT